MKKNKEKTYKKLKNIRPFNDFMFKSCYYHQLLTAYRYYGIKDELILMNSLSLYDFNDNEFKIKEYEMLSNSELEKLSGLHHVQKKKSKDIITEIIKAIDRGMPIIIAVDCYYLSYREDTYKKRHVSHFILVYGYDREKKEFIINEHAYLNSITYRETIISFKDLKAAYLSFIKRLADKGSISIIKIIREKKVEEIQDINYRELYINKRVEIEESYKNLIRAMEYLNNTLTNEEKLPKVIQKIIDSLIFMRDKKRSQKFQLIMVNASKDIIQTVERVIDNYNFAFGALSRLTFIKKYSSGTIDKMIERNKETLNLEKEIHDYLAGNI
jgi:hypothetical protein